MKFQAAIVNKSLGVLPLGSRNMATLKEISMRLKSVSNIAKITKSMKMIASTKVARAQRTMEAARAYGSSFSSFYEHAGTKSETPAELVIAVSSDRGLCGGIHSSISKATKRYLAKNKSNVVIIGQKAKSQIIREYKESISLTFDGVAKNQPTWAEAAILGDEIISKKVSAGSTKIFYNSFKSVIAFETTGLDVFSGDILKTSRIFLQFFLIL
jgi:F-type H+-transporting ATPase subunit gamma